MKRCLASLALTSLALFPACSRAADEVVASNSQSEAARDVAEAMFLESGVLETVARDAFDSSAEQIWQAYSVLPPFSAGERRDALQDYLRNRYPIEATHAVMARAPIGIDEYAMRLSQSVSEQDLREIAQFLRSDEGRSWFLHSAISSEYQPTAQEEAALAAFAETSAGRAWATSVQDISALSNSFIEPVAPAIRARVFQNICTILADECPPQMRAAANGT